VSARPIYIRNCVPVPLADIPACDTGSFCALMQEELDSRARVAAYFGCPSGSRVRLIAAIAHSRDGTIALFSCKAGAEMPSLASSYPQLQLFEREIAEQYGISFAGHPWFKPVRFCAPFGSGRDLFDRRIGDADFFAVDGEEVHEVAVGPVHAGVIEPGHFRFQCHGENVFHLEISLGYQHRGVERLVAGAPRHAVRAIIETAAGDTTAAHTTAYCQVMESLASCEGPPRAHALRALAIELERCANHIGDIGALAGDVGFLPTASYCGRIRGDVLNATALLCGSRFGRGILCEGGTAFDCDSGRLADLSRTVSTVKADFANAMDLLLNKSSVLARFENTGILTEADCRTLGVVGLAARASGIIADVRQDFAHGMYRFSHIPVVTHEQGDVFARAFVRFGEAMHSLDFVKELCAGLPEGGTRAACGPLAPNSLAVSLVEGWRGEVFHAAVTGDDGRLTRYKIVDPSFHNWNGLAFALRNQQISDFPLCNKSFNLSYCGYDL